MKLMGVPVLIDAAAGASPAVRGACAALWAELDAADWGCCDDVAECFPGAIWEEGKLIVALDERVSIVVAFNYRLGIALIEFAGIRDARSAAAPSQPRRVLR